ncbi:MAG TPA: sugar ABC transporter permease [Clostridiaceae bacterium]|nr:sugar ABC transporter permease [Clostridiaceae bacterium]
MQARGKERFKRELPLYIMLFPAVIIMLIYSYGPMIGNVIAFQRFLPGKGLFGSPFVGLDNFAYMLKMPNIWNVLYNTIFIAFMKMVMGIVVPVTVALLLNEVISSAFKRIVQTIIYLPYFLSWVILSGILITILSPSDGIVNQILGSIGIKPIFFLGDARIFPYTIVVTDIWKNFGFGTIVYLSALTSIDPTLYESAVIDGANRWQQTKHITLPGISTTVVLLSVLSMGNILNAGFEQIFNLYSPIVYSTGDIIDTLVYRTGMQNYQFGVATAVGLMKSIVAFIMIALSNQLARKTAGYRVL